MTFHLESFESLVFAGMVFFAALVLMVGITIPVFGEQRQVRKKLRRRLQDIARETEATPIQSLLRQNYLKRLNPLERALESLPLMASLAQLIDQAGQRILAYRLVLLALAMGGAAGFVVWVISHNPLIALLLGGLAFAAPFLRLLAKRRKRLETFDEQLPEAIDIIRRALLAGHPFSESLHLVAEGLEGPVAREFSITFADLNYGNDMRHAMLGLLERVPSVTLMAFVTAVLVQKETGGNLAEILERIGTVIRGRFRFQRKIKTLSAEGRLSAWILAMVPFGLFLLIYLTTPGYLAPLVEQPQGRQLVAMAFVMMLLGIVWIRRLLRIEV